MDNGQLTMGNEELKFEEAEECNYQDEIVNLRTRIDLLSKDNAELISDNLALRAKTEALLEARAALPEFSVPTEQNQSNDKYASVREAFKNANSFFKKK
jgi:hypothetical protein